MDAVNPSSLKQIAFMTVYKFHRTRNSIVINAHDGAYPQKETLIMIVVECHFRIKSDIINKRDDTF